MAKKEETKVEEVVDVKETEETTAVAKVGFFKRNANKLKAGAIVLLAFATGVAAGKVSSKTESEEPEIIDTEPEEEETAE